MLDGIARAEPFDGVFEQPLPHLDDDHPVPSRRTRRDRGAHNKSRVAIELAVALHAGTVPDYDAAPIWWQVQDLAFHAFQAAVIIVRIATEKTSRPVATICGELAASHGMEL